MNKNGFAISGMLYTILLIFLTLLVMLLYNLQNRKTILDELKINVVEATEEQAVIDALAARLTTVETDISNKRIWKKQGSTITGTASILLPTDYNELHILVKYTSSVFTYDLIKIELSTTAQNFYTGYESLTTSYGSSIITATSSQVNINNVSIDGVNQSSTSTIDVYYR